MVRGVCACLVITSVSVCGAPCNVAHVMRIVCGGMMCDVCDAYCNLWCRGVCVDDCSLLGLGHYQG